MLIANRCDKVSFIDLDFIIALTHLEFNLLNCVPFYPSNTSFGNGNFQSKYSWYSLSMLMLASVITIICLNVQRILLNVRMPLIASIFQFYYIICQANVYSISNQFCVWSTYYMFKRFKNNKLFIHRLKLHSSQVITKLCQQCFDYRVALMHIFDVRL